MDQNSNERQAPKRAIWHKFGPRLKGTWIEIKHILFQFLEIKTRPSKHFDHLANFFNILASINRGYISKFSTFFHTL